MFVVNGGVYALSAPVWGYLCDKRLPSIIVTLLGSVCIAVAFVFIGPVPFIPVPTSLGLCIGMLFIHGLGFAAQLVAAFSSAHSEALIAGKAFKIAKGPSKKDVGIFLAIFDTPLTHVGILTLIYLFSTF